VSSAHYLRSQIDNILDVLFKAGVLLLRNEVGVDKHDGVTRVSWRPRAKGELFRLPQDKLDSFPLWLREQAYSGLLFDGSLIQLTWSIAAREIVGHRLAYIPCPLLLDQELLQTEPVLDVWELARDSREPDVVLRSSIRFDFDPRAATPEHPSSHCTINTSDCRIPVASPVGPNEFFRFLFRNFYPSVWNDVGYLRSLQPSFDWERTLLDVEYQEMHLRWERLPGTLHG